MNDTTFETILRVLNEACAADRDAMLRLIETRVACNDALADHPTIQVANDPEGKPIVGVLGLINGLCEPLTGRRVAVEIDDKTGEVIRFIPFLPNVRANLTTGAADET